MVVKSTRFYPYFGRKEVTEVRVGIKSCSICIGPAMMVAKY